MSADSTSNNSELHARDRRGSISQAALTNLFQRDNSGPNGSGFPSQVNSPLDSNRRRPSVTTLGLSGTSPTSAQPFNIRRGSVSTNSNNSESMDENAIEDDDFGTARTAPSTPFARRMSLDGSTMRPVRPSGSAGIRVTPTSSTFSHPMQSGQNSSRVGAPSQESSISAALSAAGRRASFTLPVSSLSQASNTKIPRAPFESYPSHQDQQGFNWSEQLRSRAESAVTGARPSFSLTSGSPPRRSSIHDRATSVSDLPQPPSQAAIERPKQQERQKPDTFQERILKGDFYMD
ncbi:Hypothetical protein NCS54_01463800 [Fusarium falciforme]|uniref:Hypothetical protein n=1 Tax=Fusarium falciforme TaxID=195108 RepID=UPI002301ED5E|nr:Hypothetical protein NCS54_01463800 [Fusarium falciforme]WAO96941.1 Hypothetical protein NCS54_01463800 [Fusarium falciforme]